MKTLIIDRSKWRTGGSGLNKKFGPTHLLNRKGMMCCLGFFCKQAGLEDHIIADCPEPNEVGEDYFKKIPELIFEDESYLEPEWYPSKLSADAMEINDDEDLTPNTRESRIKQLFFEHGIEVTFENKYPKP